MKKLLLAKRLIQWMVILEIHMLILGQVSDNSFPSAETTPPYIFNSETFRPITNSLTSETQAQSIFTTKSANPSDVPLSTPTPAISALGTSFSQVIDTTPTYFTPPSWLTTEERYTDVNLDFQIIYNGIYSQFPTNLSDQQSILAKQINQIVNIPPFDVTRIKDIKVRQSKLESEVLLSFKLLTNANSSVRARDAAKAIFNAISLNLNGPIIFSSTVILSKARGSCYWSDYSNCPDSPCQSGLKCFANYNCGKYCSKNEQSFLQSNTSDTNNALLGLIAIPVVFVVALIIVIVALILYRRPKAGKKSAIELNEFGYTDATSKFGNATLRKPSGTIIAEPGIRNKVYSTMGRSFEMGWDVHGNNPAAAQKGFDQDKYYDDGADEGFSQKF